MGNVEPGELEALTEEVAERVDALLQSLVIDTENDHNTRETGARVARMYVAEVFAGRYTPSPDLTAFPNVTSYDEHYLVGHAGGILPPAAGDEGLQGLARRRATRRHIGSPGMTGAASRGLTDVSRSRVVPSSEDP